MRIDYFKPFLSIVVISIIAAGCLKDKGYTDGSTQSESQGAGGDVKVISLGVTVSSAVSPQFLQTSYDISNSDTTVNLVPVELGGASDASQDIHITIAVSDSLVADYNNNIGTDFIDPGSNVTIVNNVVTIPKGGRIGYLQVKFKSSDLLNGNFAYGFIIASVQESGYVISGNLNTAIIAMGPKNKYDGLYGMTMESVGWGAYGIDDGISEIWPSNVGLVTTGASSVIFNTQEAGPLQPAFAGGSITAFGATTPQFTFDPATDKLVSVVNLIPNDGRNRQFAINPAVTDSRYDDATKTIYLAYLMTQNGRPAQYIYDTLAYKGSR